MEEALQQSDHLRGTQAEVRAEEQIVEALQKATTEEPRAKEQLAEILQIAAQAGEHLADTLDRAARSEEYLAETLQRAATEELRTEEHLAETLQQRAATREEQGADLTTGLVRLVEFFRLEPVRRVAKWCLGGACSLLMVAFTGVIWHYSVVADFTVKIEEAKRERMAQEKRLAALEAASLQRQLRELDDECTKEQGQLEWDESMGRAKCRRDDTTVFYQNLPY